MKYIWKPGNHREEEIRNLNKTKKSGVLGPKKKSNMVGMGNEGVGMALPK